MMAYFRSHSLVVYLLAPDANSAIRLQSEFPIAVPEGEDVRFGGTKGFSLVRYLQPTRIMLM